MLERIGGGGGRESITIISHVSHPTIINLLLLFIDNNLYRAS